MTYSIPAVAKAAISQVSPQFRTSSYYTLAKEDRTRDTLTVGIKLEISQDGKESWYSVHSIDDINRKDCELRCTEDASEESLVKVLTEILGATLHEYDKLKPYVVEIVEEYHKTIIVWAKNGAEAEMRAEEMCNDGTIDIDYEGFATRSCTNDGQAKQRDIDLLPEYDRPKEDD